MRKCIKIQRTCLLLGCTALEAVAFWTAFSSSLIYAVLWGCCDPNTNFAVWQNYCQQICLQKRNFQPKFGLDGLIKPAIPTNITAFGLAYCDAHFGYSIRAVSFLCWNENLHRPIFGCGTETHIASKCAGLRNWSGDTDSKPIPQIIQLISCALAAEARVTMMYVSITTHHPNSAHIRSIFHSLKQDNNASLLLVHPLRLCTYYYHTPININADNIIRKGGRMSSTKQSNQPKSSVDFTLEELDQLLNDPTTSLKPAARMEYKGIFALRHMRKY